MKYTWYHISKLLEGHHYGCTGSQILRREEANWNALMSHRWSLYWHGLWFLSSVNIWAIWIIFLLSGSFWLKLIWLYVIHEVILTTQLGYVLEQFFAHLFTCFCMGSTDFRSTGCVEVTSAFRSFHWKFQSLSSFKMVVPTGH